MNKGLIIFDLDGTLFRTETVDVEAFNKALSINGFKPWREQHILELIGLTLDRICESLIGAENPDMLRKLKEDIIRYEEEVIHTSGQLYSGVKEFLNRLKERGFTLCICSNGNEEYVKAIANKFDFDSLFEEIWFEKKEYSKSQAIAVLKEKFAADSFIMIGDRLCDITAAKENQGISIGVSYGFGKAEVHLADYVAHNIGEVEDIIMEVYSKSNI